MTDINETNANMSDVPVIVLPREMSVKEFNRIYGTHDTLKGVYKLHQKIIAEFIATTLFIFGVVSSSF